MKKQIFENVMKTIIKQKLQEAKVKKKLEVDFDSGIDESTTVDLDDTALELEETLDMTGMGGKDVSQFQSHKKESSCGVSEEEDNEEDNEEDFDDEDLPAEDEVGAEDEEEVEEGFGDEIGDRMKNTASKMSPISGKPSPFDDVMPKPGESEMDFVTRMKKVYKDMGNLASQQETKFGEGEDEPMSMMKAVKEAAPSDKAEKFIKKNKEDFKKRYGTKWKDRLYATASKMFPEDD